jgi:hypothetical protein
MTKEFYSETDLDEMGFYSRSHRRRLRQQGVLPWPVKIGGPASKGHTPKEVIDTIKARAGKPEAAGA